jgi:putative (di)nucleoside polyphosphate hydrolase
VIDPDGYRPNVGIILLREDGQVFWARRAFRDGWQFPQGGMRSDETPLEAMYRELQEETGLKPQHVEVIGATPGWLRYRLPPRMVRRNQFPRCIGQKQVWFLLKFLGEESALKLDASDEPEFDDWRWVDFWYPATHVVSFKRGVYQRALRHLAPMAENYCHLTLAEALAVAGDMAQNALAAAESMVENARAMSESMHEIADQMTKATLAKVG